MSPRWWWSSVAALLVAVLWCAVGDATARDERAPGSIGEIALAELPVQARETLALIKRGGPFPYRKDGSTFHNREKRLPLRPRGYYSEYTVRTPGSRDRGARRIVAGRGATGRPATSGEYYYTNDHYETFRRIRE
jgi:ribonuclease T1